MVVIKKQVRRKQSREAPEWLVNLPAGTYTGSELVEITGITLPALTRTMLKYGVVKITKRRCYRNLSMNIYIWSGELKTT